MARSTFRVSDACRALGVALGAALLWAFLVGWMTQRYRGHSDMIHYTPDGTILVKRLTRRGAHFDETYHRLVGDRLEPAKTPKASAHLYPHLVADRRASAFRSSEFDCRVARFLDPGSPDRWHFVVERLPDAGGPGRGYFVQFDTRTRRPTRYIGREGELSTRPDRDQTFLLRDDWTLRLNREPGGEEPGIDWRGGDARYFANRTAAGEEHAPRHVALSDDDRVVDVDLAARMVRPLPGTEGLVDLQLSDEMLPREGLPAISASVLHGRTRSSLFRIDPFTFDVQSFRLPESLADSWIGIGVISSDQAVLVIQDELFAAGRQDVARLSADGTLSDRVNGVVPAGSQDTYSPRALGVLMATMLPSPALWLPIEYQRQTEMRAVPRDEVVGFVWPAALLTVLASLLAVVLGELWTRRYRQSAHPLWWAFLFLFGLPGLVGYVVHRKWPARAAITSPAPNGQEIFA